MALLFIDGFDHYNVAGQKGWSVAGGAGITSGGRTGQSLYTQGNWQGGYDGSAQKAFPARGEVVVGMAIKLGHGAGALPWRIEMREGGTAHLSIQMDGASRLEFRRGVGGTVMGTTTSPLVNGSYVHLAFRLKVHDTTGTLIVKVNDATEISLSGIDTRNGGAAGLLDSIVFISGQITFEGAWNMQYDDLYICDVVGTLNADFRGDAKVETIYPNGNGNASQFVGSDGNSTDNYLLVDEALPNSDTDYVDGQSVGHKDTYAMGNLVTSTGFVQGVQPCPFWKKSDAGARAACTVARLSGTEVDSSPTTLSTSYAYSPDIREERPGGGAWTFADVNAAEFGAKVTT
jgi:hypothetical protein